MEIEDDAKRIASDFTSVLDTCNPDSPLGKNPEEARMENIYCLLIAIVRDSQNLLAQVEVTVNARYKKQAS
jgi:hypothetical protein